jgi:hypothetical protein
MLKVKLKKQKAIKTRKNKKINKGLEFFPTHPI